MIPLLLAPLAALASPLWVNSGRWRRLLAVASPAAASPLPARAIRSCLRTLALLARVFPGVRNTCLYRSVAVCLLLRWCGGSAVLRLGAAGGDVHAHAWVESGAGELLYEHRTGWVPFRGVDPA